MASRSEPLVYLNGRFIAADQAAIPIWDRGVVQAATVTEMIRTFRGVPFRLPQHLSRLESSLSYLGVTLSESPAQISEIVSRLIELNHCDHSRELGIVLFATPGAIPMYAGDSHCETTPTFCAHTFPLPIDCWREKYRTGQSLVVPSIHQIPPEILNPQVKYRSRLHWYLADREAQQSDPTAVALLQNQRGHLTETNSGNFFIVTDGRILTPADGDTLPGISQAYVQELANALSIPYEAVDITLAMALEADEAFTTSTSYCVWPVTRLNQQSIGTGVPGPVTQALLQAWSTAVGFDITTATPAEDLLS